MIQERKVEVAGRGVDNTQSRLRRSLNNPPVPAIGQKKIEGGM